MTSAKRIPLLFLASLFCINPAGAQYTSPESIIHDAANSRYIVSDAGAGLLRQRSPAGTVTTFASGLTQPKGLVISGSVVYVADVTTVRGYNLSSAAPVFTVVVPGAAFLNDIVVVGTDLYLSDTQTHAIYTVNITTQAVSTFVSSGIQSPNGLLHDAANNRLLLVSFRTNSPIQAVDLSTAGVSTVTTTSLSNLDGITTDGIGNYYVSNWGTNQVHFFNSAFSNTPIVVASGFNGPADIFYNAASDTLAVPSMNAGTVVFVGMAKSLATSPLGSNTLCAGVSFSLAYTASGFFSGNVFTAQLSNAAGSFVSPVVIGTVTASGSGSIPVTIPVNTPAGSGYRIRVISSAPGFTGTDNGSDVTISSGNPTSLTWTGAVNAQWGTVGNWNHPCAIPTAGDTVLIPSSVTPPSAIPAISLARLQLDNAAGIVLTNNLQITGTLALLNGTITLNTASLDIGPSGAIDGAGPTSFVVTNGSGELRQAYIGSVGRADSVLFPVGVTASRYAPLLVKNLGTVDEFRVRVVDGVRENGTSGTVLSSHVVAQTWLISEVTAGGSNAELVFGWSATDEAASFIRTSCFVARHDGSGWNPLQSAGAALGPGPYVRAVSGVTAFSPFAVGDSLSTLPVDLLACSAERTNTGVLIQWTTAGENGCHGFEIQRADASVERWTTLGFVAARNGGARRSEYRFEDLSAADGLLFYRLHMIDADGSHSYAPVVRVAEHSTHAAIGIRSVYPNPLRPSSSAVGGMVVVSAETLETVHLTIHDAMGRVVARVPDYSPRHSGLQSIPFRAVDLAPGRYVVLMLQGPHVSRHMVAVMR